MRQLFVLSHEAARRNAIQAVLDAPNGYHVEVKQSTRSLEQNALLHVKLQQLSKVYPWAGKLRDVDTWKRLMVAAWLRAKSEQIEILPAIDKHGVDIVFRHTSKMTISEVTELIEFIDAWCAEMQIDLEHGAYV